MPSADKTPNYGLNQWQGNEFVKREDFVNDNALIDTELKRVEDKADAAFTQADNGKSAIKSAIVGKDPDISIPTNATFAQLATAIGQIQTGVDTGDATATAEQILAGMTAYAQGQKITGTMPSKGAQTYIPGATVQTIGARQYLSGAQTILPGTRFAGGITTVSGDTKNFTSPDGSVLSRRYITVGSLSFNPTCILCKGFDGTAEAITIYNDKPTGGISKQALVLSVSEDSFLTHEQYIISEVGDAGFTLPTMATVVSNINWYAYE